MKNQSEMQADLELLELQGKFLRAAIEKKTGERISAPEICERDIFAATDALQAHVNFLQQKLQGALPSSQATTPEHGQHAAESEQKKNLTDKCKDEPNKGRYNPKTDPNTERKPAGLTKQALEQREKENK